VGFKPTISAGEGPKTYALDRAATGTGINPYMIHIISCYRHKFLDMFVFILGFNPFQPRDAIWHHAFHVFLICMPFAHWLQ